MHISQRAKLSARELAVVLRGEEVQAELERQHKQIAVRKAKPKVERNSHPTREHILFNKIWKNILDRCQNPNSKSYKWYGGLGVKVCQEWQDYKQFFADMWPRPSPQHSVDRINPYGDYSKENCRWATAAEQASNKRFKENSNV